MCDFLNLAALCRGRHVYIQTHNFPDPDAIASAFGLQGLLSRYEDIQTTLCYDGEIDKLSALKMLDAFQIRMHPYAQLRERMTAEDYIVCVDTQKHGGNVTDLAGEEVACIDHHPTFAAVEYRYKDIRILGACATIITQYYQQLCRQPDRDTATALLYGLKMDTLQFTRGVTKADIDAFSYLLPLCDQEKLTRLERNNLEFQDLKAYGAAIESIEIYGTVGFSSIPFPCPDAMIGILADFILSLDEVEVAIVYAHREDGIKFSIRSEDPRVHAGEVIHRALKEWGNGGGHAAMAGGLIHRDKIHLLGFHPQNVIRETFLRCMGR